MIRKPPPASPVYLRHVTAADEPEFLDLMRRSKSLHEPWISPPRTELSFKYYMDRVAREDHEGLLVCRKANNQIVGTINLNNIVYGSFLSASLGYYVGQGFAGKGYMTQGLNLIKDYAIMELGLHRLEANIQPHNLRSIALVKTSGFEFEGVSADFLFIDGRWRDHERWVYRDNRSSLYGRSKRKVIQRQPVS